MKRAMPARNLLQSPVAAAVLVLLAAVLPYLHTLGYPFVLDDTLAIGENPIIQDLGRFLGGEGFRHRALRFVGNLTLALNYHFGALNTFGYHLVNIGIHALSALLVYLLVQLTFRTPPLRDSLLASRRTLLALGAALLFAVHPIQTQAVTYIVQRFASLAALFYLLALVLYACGRLRLQGREERDRESGIADRESASETPRHQALLTTLFFAGAAIAAGLAMLTKEIAFTLPMMIVLYEISFFPPSRRRRRLAGVLAGLAAAALALLALFGPPAAKLLEEFDSHLRESETVSRGDYLLTQFRVIVTYLRLLFLPVNQNLDYDYPAYHSFLTPPVFLSFLLLTGLAGLAVWLYWQSGKRQGETGASAAEAGLPTPYSVSRFPYAECRLIAFGILWFFLALAVESSVIPIADVMVEHRLYLPSVGIAIAVTTAVLLQRRLPPRLLPVLLVVVVVVLGTATVRRNLVWSNPITLWSDVVGKSPANERGWCNLGAAYLERGEAKKGTDHLLTAVQVNPDYSKAWLNLGVGFGQQGMYPEAAQALETALVKNPRLWLAHVNLGTIYMRMGRLETAIEHLETAVGMNPGDAVARSQLDHLRRFPNPRTAEKQRSP